LCGPGTAEADAELGGQFISDECWTATSTDCDRVGDRI
jgi:hypothetical protein